MSNKEEEFPFEQFVEALQQKCNIRKKINHIIEAICEKNIYWIYSAMSTLIEILKGKDEEPIMKCRSLEAANILLQTCEYPVVTFIEVYLLPLLIQVVNFRGRKSEELASQYFQLTQKCQDTPEIKKYSLEFIERAVEMIHYAAKLKPYRTVETGELKQESLFAKALKQFSEKGIETPKVWKWCSQQKTKDHRKLFLQKLRVFGQESEEWTQFLLVNLLEEVNTGKKQLLELRILLNYGQSFLTSSMINLCEQQLLQITQNLQLKRKYLGLLHQLVRYGDIQAIIMIKNSQFIPVITAHISKLPGHVSINQGENIFPEVKATKKVKKEFYIDFLRCLQTWSITMPPDYDSDDFNIKSIYQFLKTQKKFKFPENMHLASIKSKLQKICKKTKKETNIENSKSQSVDKTPLSKVSNVLQKTTLLAPKHLELKIQQVCKWLKQLIANPQIAEKAFNNLVQFKDNWITYLECLDFDGGDEVALENLINAGQKYVQQIQLIVPLHTSLSKGKVTFKQFRQKVIENLQFHNDVSQNQIQVNKSLNKSKSITISKLAQSKLAKSKLGKSKFASKIGKSLFQKMKSRSRIGDKTKLDASKAMDRSNMLQKSKYLDRSKSRIQNLKPQKEVDYNQQHEQNDGTKPINLKSQKQMKSNTMNDDQQSIIQKYKAKSKAQLQKQEKKEVDTPNKQKSNIRNKIFEEKQTTKKPSTHSRLKSSDSEEDEQKVVRVADYQVEPEIPKKSALAPRLSHSRGKDSEKGSRLLARRSRDRGSRIQSSDSKISVERNSRSSRKVKQTSLFKKNQIEHNKTKKINESQNNLIENQKIKQNKFIQNPKILAGKKAQIQIEQSYNKFRDQAGEISSIHSNSQLKVFHYSAEKILNMTDQLTSEIEKPNQYKQGKKQLIEQFVPEAQIPLVGDYYQEDTKKSRTRKLEYLPKNIEQKEQTEELNQFRDILDNKTSKTNRIFNKEKQQVKNNSINKKIQGNSQRQSRNTAKDIKNVKQSVQYPLHNQDARNSARQLHQPVQSSSAKAIPTASEQLEKDKEIAALRAKIHQLEQESRSMRNKLAAKDNQIRSIKSGSVNSSERGFAQFTSPSNSNYQKSSLRGSSASKKGEMTKFQKEIESGFKQYLERIKGNTFRKSLLKIKCLVHKTDDIEIGCLSQRGQKTLQSTLYITPQRSDILDFTITIIHDHNLWVKTAPEHIKMIPALKQHKVHITIEVVKIPFCLPQFQINYKSNSQYSSNYNRLTLPIAFNKFCLIKPLSIDSTSERQISYVRTDSFKINTKVVKLEKLVDSIPNFAYIPPSKSKPQHLLAANCCFGDASFNILLNLHEKSSWIEGFLLQGQVKAMHFLMCTLKEILDGSKK